MSDPTPPPESRHAQTRSTAAAHLGIKGSNGEATEPDLIAAICRDKRMPVDAFMQFEPTIATFGRKKTRVIRGLQTVARQMSESVARGS